MSRIRRRPAFGIRSRAAIAIFATFVLTVSACGGDDDGAEPTFAPGNPTQTTAATPGATAAPGGPPDQTFPIGQHFWHSGFRVELVEGEIVSTENTLSRVVTTVLTISATLENLGSDTGYFGPAIAVVTSNNSYTDSFSSEIPNVGGGLKGQASFNYRIDDGFDLASAELVVGSADENQARVPLGATGDAVRLEPSEPVIAGTLSMELIDLVFTSASLRYDDWDRHREAAKGKQFLILNFDAVSRKGGNWNVFATDFALVLPDGTSVAPDSIEIGSLPGSDTGVTTPDRFVQFSIDEMSSGDFTLRLTPGSWFVGDDGATEGSFEFAL